MPGSLSKAQDVFLDKISQICGKFGLNNIMVQIYALLYLSDKPLSLDDMVKQLEISKGSASINIRALEGYGAVKRVWFRGSRKDYYEAEEDISRVISERIRSMVEKHLSEIGGMIDSSFEAINSVVAQGQEDQNALEVYRQRLTRLKNFHDKANALLDLFKSSMISGILNDKINGLESSAPQEAAAVTQEYKL